MVEVDGGQDAAAVAGLAERLALAGGELHHGTNAMGDFVLRAAIPGHS